jgi:hypothetical protein
MKLLYPFLALFALWYLWNMGIWEYFKVFEEIQEALK